MYCRIFLKRAPCAGFLSCILKNNFLLKDYESYLQLGVQEFKIYETGDDDLLVVDFQEVAAIQCSRGEAKTADAQRADRGALRLDFT